jgi:hypothetical protein
VDIESCSSQIEAFRPDPAGIRAELSQRREHRIHHLVRPAAEHLDTRVAEVEERPSQQVTRDDTALAGPRVALPLFAK